MSVLRSGNSITRVSAAPAIKGFSRKGFVIGWIAIVCLVAAGFAMMTLPLNHASTDLRFAHIEPENVALEGRPRG